jgi:hypothetical protein
VHDQLPTSPRRHLLARLLAGLALAAASVVGAGIALTERGQDAVVVTVDLAPAQQLVHPELELDARSPLLNAIDSGPGVSR